MANAVYDDAGLAGLVAPAGDAAGLARVLADPEVCGFEVSVLVDGSSAEVRRAVDDFLAERERGDLLLLYFSCHGLKDEQGRLYFAARDTRRDRLPSTATPAGFVNELLLGCRSRRKVLVLDCCYSGAFATGLRVKSDPQVHTAAHFDARGMVVLTASDAAQYAFDGDAVRGSAARSAFTEALIAGLATGEADLDGDGLVSVDDAHEFVRRRLADLPQRQSPRKWEFDVQGRIVLGRSGRPAGAAAPPAVLPPAPAGAEPVVRQPAWWGALAAAAAAAAGVSGLVGWVLARWAYGALPDEYVAPGVAGAALAAALAGGAWGAAYAVVGALGPPVRADGRGPFLRWARLLGTVVVPRKPRPFLRALAEAVPLNVAGTLAVCGALAALTHPALGAEGRERLFHLAFVVLTAVPLGAYLRRAAGPD
ncbi:hypothetical protein J3R04_000789 [Spirilliplanes yamanashiensis]|nr:hypothetical protein [Spirilliplanes yamanashiensis]